MSQSAASFRRFELALEALTPHNSVSTARAQVPAGPTSLVFDDTPHVVETPPANGSPALLLEPVQHGRDAALLIVAPVGRVLRVNGVPSGRVVCVQPGDVVEPGVGDWIAEIATTTRWRLGVPPESLLGARCPMCHRVFDEKTVAWICPVCGTGLHMEPGTDGEPLKCLEFKTECPTCRLAIDRADEEEEAMA